MKKIIWLALALSLMALPSHAQQVPVSDISVGYSFFHSGSVNLNGVSGSGAYYANDWFGLAGDVGVYHGSPGGASVTAVTYTFGPRFSIRRSERVVPYAQALFGGSHLSAAFGGFSGSVNPFAFSVGGGAEIAIASSGKVVLRPEVEYFGLRANGGTGNCVRISASIAYHFGQR